MRNVAAIGLVPLLPALSAAEADDRESWSLSRVRSELRSLPVRSETSCARAAVTAGWQDLEPDIEALHGGPFSPYDGLCFPNYHYVDVEHVVSRKEADESGMCSQGLERRKAFAADTLNLTFAPGSLNSSKGKLDAGDIVSAESSLFRDELTDAGRCFWAAQTVRVKAKYLLAVDSAEKTELIRIFRACRSVSRPQYPAACGWTLRPEYAAAAIRANRAPGSYCSEPSVAQRWRAAVQYASDIACLPGSPPEPESTSEATAETASESAEAETNPRATQIAAQRACKAKLDRVTCSNIKRHCPDVEPIRRGEPLYQPKGTNGRSNDADNDGVCCESL